MKDSRYILMQGTGEGAISRISLKNSLSTWIEWMEVTFTKMGKTRKRLKGKRLKVQNCT